jgi:hypothetical protein
MGLALFAISGLLGLAVVTFVWLRASGEPAAVDGGALEVTVPIGRPSRQGHGSPRFSAKMSIRVTRWVTRRA